MDNMKWMAAEKTLEEELTLERMVRSIDDINDITDIRRLCGSLVRQNWHQRKLLSQAVGRIAEMDAQAACSD
jgi:hypothetical protein